VSGQPQVPVFLPPGKEPWYPQNIKLSGLLNRSGHLGVEKIFFAPAGKRNTALKITLCQ